MEGRVPGCRFPFAFSAFILLLSLLSPPALARRAVVVAVAGVGWEDLSRAVDRGYLPAVSAREGELAWGMVNVVTPRKKTEEAYVGLGAGGRAAAAPCVGEAWERGEGREHLYSSWTGLELPPGRIFHPCVAAIRKSQEELDHSILPGLLGESLRLARKKVAVLGNADSVPPPGTGGAWQPGRHLVAAAMDFRGSVPLGAVGEEVVRKERGFPGGVRTDYQTLEEELDRILPEADLILMESGDFLRLDAWRSYLSPEAWEESQKEAFGELSRLLDHLFRHLRPGEDLLFLLSLSPGEPERKEGFFLTPLVVWGWGGGVLTSPTTRSRGVVAEADLLPTWLGHLGVKPASSLFYGRPVERVALSGGAARQELDRLGSRLKRIHLLRRPYIKFYVGAGVALVLGGWLLPQGVRPPVLLSYAALPLGLLLAALSPWLLLPLSLLLLRPGPRSFVLLSLATSFAVGAHALLGSPLEPFTLIGHSPISGARFYGLGNEYLGVFLGSTLFALPWVEAGTSRWQGLAARLLALAWLLAVPALGANYGGMAAAALGGGVLLLTGLDRRLRPAVALGGIGASLLFLLSSLKGGTHASLLLGLARSGGWEVVAETALRKVEMNYRLMLLTRWSWLLLAFCVAFFCLLLRERRFAPLGMVALGAFLLNDSGVVAAALALSFPAAYYLAFPGDWAAGVRPPGDRERGRGGEAHSPPRFP